MVFQKSKYFFAKLVALNPVRWWKTLAVCCYIGKIETSGMYEDAGNFFNENDEVFKELWAAKEKSRLSESA